MLNEYGVDFVYFWHKVEKWAKDVSKARGRPVTHNEMIREWLKFIRP